MRIVIGLAVAVLLVVVAGALYVRLAPLDPAAWHGDPQQGYRTGDGGWLVLPAGGDVAAPVYPATPADLLAQFDRIALSTPRTTILAGSVGEGRITYVTRSALIGFPDLTTVEALPAEGGATLAIFARQRFGGGDLGVNRARVEGWLARLAAARGP